MSSCFYLKLHAIEYLCKNCAVISCVVCVMSTNDTKHSHIFVLNFLRHHPYDARRLRTMEWKWNVHKRYGPHSKRLTYEQNLHRTVRSTAQRLIFSFKPIQLHIATKMSFKSMEQLDSHSHSACQSSWAHKHTLFISICSICLSDASYLFTVYYHLSSVF